MSLSVSLQRAGASRRVERGRDEQAWIAALATLTAGVLVLRLTQMHQSLYGDELWTFQQVAHQSLTSMMHAIRPPGENAPPLFFLMAWVTAKIGNASVWVRLPSLVLGVATVPVVYLLGRETVGRTAGLIGAAVIALNPFSTYYTIEARPYAAMAFFVVLSTFALVRAVRSESRRWWAVYVVAAAAAAYTGYTAVFPLAVQAVWSLWACRDRIRQPILADVAVAVLYLPWLPHIGSRELAIIGLLEPFSLHNVLIDLMRATAGYPYAPLSAIPTVPGLVVIGACAAGGLFALAAHARRRAYEGSGLRLIAALALAAPAGVALYSLVGTDIWDARDLYASVPAAALTLGALIAAIRGRLRLIAAAGVLVVLLAGTIRAIGPSYARPPFRDAAAYLDRVAGPRDPIVMLPSFLGLDADLPIQFLRPHTLVDGDPPRWPSRPAGRPAFAVQDGQSSGPGRPPAPRPRGYVLVARRGYSGMLPFMVLTYRSTG